MHTRLNSLLRPQYDSGVLTHLYFWLCALKSSRACRPGSRKILTGADSWSTATPSILLCVFPLLHHSHRPGAYNCHGIHGAFQRRTSIVQLWAKGRTSALAISLRSATSWQQCTSSFGWHFNFPGSPSVFNRRVVDEKALVKEWCTTHVRVRVLPKYVD